MTNVNHLNIFSKFLPGFQEIKESVCHNFDLPHCTENVYSSLNSSKILMQNIQKSNPQNHHSSQIRKYSGINDTRKDSYAIYNNIASLTKKSSGNQTSIVNNEFTSSNLNFNTEHILENQSIPQNLNVGGNTSHNNSHTFNLGTYSTFSLNQKPLKIFEFEESQATKLKKKVEVKKPDNKNKDKKKDELTKISQNAKKMTFEPTLNHALVQEYNKQFLDKMKLESLELVKPGLVENYGELYSLKDDCSPEKLNVHNPMYFFKEPKRNFNSNTPNPKDEIISNIENYNIYCSDKVLSVIMTMNIFSRPWHVYIRKTGEKVYLDIDETSGVYYTDIPSNDYAADDEDCKSINHIENLMTEASIINQYIKEISLGQKIECEETSKFGDYPFKNLEAHDILERTPGKAGVFNPIHKHEELNERCLYSYKEWSIGNDLKILIRCQIHAGELLDYKDEDEKPTLLKYNIYALNEYNVSSFSFYFN